MSQKRARARAHTHTHTHTHTHSHTHTHTHTHTHSLTHALLKVTELTLTHLEISPMCPDKRPLLCCVCRARAPCWPECVCVCVCVCVCERECVIPAADLRSDCVEFWWSDTATEGASTNHTLFDIISDNCASVQTSVVSDWSLTVHLISLLIT